MARLYFDPERAADAPDMDNMDELNEARRAQPEGCGVIRSGEDFYADIGGPFESYQDWE